MKKLSKNINLGDTITIDNQSYFVIGFRKNEEVVEARVARSEWDKKDISFNPYDEIETREKEGKKK